MSPNPNNVTTQPIVPAVTTLDEEYRAQAPVIVEETVPVGPPVRWSTYWLALGAVVATATMSIIASLLGITGILPPLTQGSESSAPTPATTLTVRPTNGTDRTTTITVVNPGGPTELIAVQGSPDASPSASPSASTSSVSPSNTPDTIMVNESPSGTPASASETPQETAPAQEPSPTETSNQSAAPDPTPTVDPITPEATSDTQTAP